jgi:DNA modification methylase
LEDTPEAFVQQMVEVFREARRVLRDDGTLWLNLGDSYAGSGKGGNPPDSPHAKQQTNKGTVPFAGRSARAQALTNITRRTSEIGCKPKDLIGIPWMVAFALRADGWYLRSEIVWHKPNCMPESVRDRPTCAHEKLFLFSKSPAYYYDADAIAEDAIYSGLTGQDASGFKDPETFGGKHGRPDKQRGHGRRHAGFNDRWDAMSKTEQCGGKRNKRNVWTVPVSGYSGAHFATYPPSLIEPCILAGCPVGGTVLDPFGGAGTTGMVADRLQRNAVLIELNPEYAAIAEHRLHGDAGMFAEIEAA